MLEEKRVGIIGYSSKRYNNFYRKILSDLKINCTLWNRSAMQYTKLDNEEIVKDVNQLISAQDIDLVFCFVNDKNNFDFLSQYNFNCPVLIETPVTDPRWFDFDRFEVGVLEQWPYYPLEEFKRIIYQKEIIKKPYQLMNDGRTFDYHSIAQLRSFANYAYPTKCIGLVQNVKQEKFKDDFGKYVDNIDDWTYGLSELSNGAVIIYNFTYNCKKSVLKPYQLIRHVSSNGSITTGREKEMGNDYEVGRITYLNNEKVYESKIEVKSDNQVTKEIFCQDLDISWKNIFVELSFNDAEVAAATLIKRSMEGLFYSAKNAYIDILTTSAMKQSAHQKQFITFQ